MRWSSARYGTQGKQIFLNTKRSIWRTTETQYRRGRELLHCVHWRYSNPQECKMSSIPTASTTRWMELLEVAPQARAYCARLPAASSKQMSAVPRRTNALSLWSKQEPRNHQLAYCTRGARYHNLGPDRSPNRQGNRFDSLWCDD